MIVPNAVDLLAGQDDHAIRVKEVGKSYQIWSDPSARIKVPLLRLAARKIPALEHIVDARVQSLCSEFRALNNISFDLPRGTSMAIIGRNGSGKSTLLQIIAGTLKPTYGAVERSGRIAALLELGSGFNPEFTGRENVYMNGAIYGLDADQISARMLEVEEFAEIGVHIDQPVKTYSSGMMMRLAFSVQVLMDPEILIVDEALSVGDIFFQQKCFERMRRLSEAGTSILFVSHDLVTVAQFTQTALVLRDGEAVFLGDSGVAVKEYQIMERSSSCLPASREVGSVETLLAQRSSSDSSLGVQTAVSIDNLTYGRIKPSPLAQIDLNGVVQIGVENAEFTYLSRTNRSGT
jgi:ABC-type polysaccharide/polyol phosphate transport system ATPase subunit